MQVTEQTYRTDAHAARAEFSSLLNTVQASIHVWFIQVLVTCSSLFSDQSSVAAAYRQPWQSSSWRLVLLSSSAIMLPISCLERARLHSRNTCSGTCTAAPQQSAPESAVVSQQIMVGTFCCGKMLSCGSCRSPWRHTELKWQR